MLIGRIEMNDAEARVLARLKGEVIQSGQNITGGIFLEDYQTYLANVARKYGVSTGRVIAWAARLEVKL